jgi:hypothetical protein
MIVPADCTDVGSAFGFIDADNLLECRPLGCDIFATEEKTIKLRLSRARRLFRSR